MQINNLTKNFKFLKIHIFLETNQGINHIKDTHTTSKGKL